MACVVRGRFIIIISWHIDSPLRQESSVTPSAGGDGWPCRKCVSSATRRLLKEMAVVGVGEQPGVGCSTDSGVVWLYTTASRDPWKGWQAGTVMFSPGFPCGRRNESRDRVGEDVTQAVVNGCASSLFLLLYVCDP